MPPRKRCSWRASGCDGWDFFGSSPPCPRAGHETYTGFRFTCWRTENSDAHGKALQKLDSIAETLDHVDSEIEEIAEWQRDHERVHDELSGG